MTLEQGEDGWAGPVVYIRRLDEHEEPRLWAIAHLASDGTTVTCDNASLLQKWTEKGIVGRASRGRLFPHQGQAFLDELPYMYKSAYMMAEPAMRSELLPESDA